MNRPTRYQNQRDDRGNHQRRNAAATDNGEPTLEQYAGGVARNLIKQTGVEDSTQIWRALKRAYLAGYADGQR